MTTNNQQHAAVASISISRLYGVAACVRLLPGGYTGYDDRDD